MSQQDWEPLTWVPQPLQTEVKHQKHGCPSGWIWYSVMAVCVGTCVCGVHMWKLEVDLIQVSSYTAIYLIN